MNWKRGDAREQLKEVYGDRILGKFKPKDPREEIVLAPAERPVPRGYRAVEDPHFPGTWRAEPIDYCGRGFVYLFRGKDARTNAEACAREKNAGRSGG